MQSRAFVVDRDQSGTTSWRLENVTIAESTPNRALIKVAFSSINYKDLLAAEGHPGIVRKFPHVPGIDLCGTLVSTDNSTSFVIATGHQLGMGEWGGWSEFVSVNESELLPLPANLSPQEAMALGTAGLTAGFSMDQLLRHGIAPARGPILVTGGSGGVGSLAISILHRLGFEVHAISSRPQFKDWLLSIGASEVHALSSLTGEKPRPLQTAKWQGAIDTVGGNLLGHVLARIQPRGCVTTCGMVAGTDFSSSIYPFILRGIALVGIDSAEACQKEKREIWTRLAADWKPTNLSRIFKEIDLGELPAALGEMKSGQHTGRKIVRVTP